MRVPTVDITPEAGPLVCGPCKLNERMGSMTGITHKVYNNGWAALFQADNGPVFTILPRDLDSEQPPLTVEEVLRELARIFRQPLANITILPLFGYSPGLMDATLIGAAFTAISLIRSYLMRRLFNWIGVRYASSAK